MLLDAAAAVQMQTNFLKIDNKQFDIQKCVTMFMSDRLVQVLRTLEMHKRLDAHRTVSGNNERLCRGVNSLFAVS